MADFSQTIREPSLQAPIFDTPVDNSTANAIRTGGELFLNTDARIATDSLAGELNEIEQAEIDRFKSINRQLEQGIEQSDPALQASFRTRAATALKSAINRRPGLAYELRQTAQSALGFDPTGGELDDVMARYRALSEGIDERAENQQWLWRKSIDALAGDAKRAGFDEATVYRNADNPRALAEITEKVNARLAQKRGYELISTEAKAAKDWQQLQGFEKQSDVRLYSNQLGETIYEEILARYDNNLEALVNDPNSVAVIEAAVARAKTQATQWMSDQGLNPADFAADLEAAMALPEILTQYATGKVTADQAKNRIQATRDAAAHDFITKNLSHETIGFISAANELGLTDSPGFNVVSRKVQMEFTAAAKKAVSGPYANSDGATVSEAGDRASVIRSERLKPNRRYPDLSDATSARQALQVTREATIESIDKTRPYDANQWLTYTDLMERAVTKPFANPDYQKIPDVEKERLVQFASMDLQTMMKEDPDGTAIIARDFYQGIKLYSNEIIDTHRSAATSNRDGAHLIAFAPDVEAGVIFVPINQSTEAQRAADHWNEQLGGRAYGAALKNFMGDRAQQELGSPEQHAFREAVMMYDVPADLVKAIMHVESRSDPDKDKWNNDASSGQAGGVMQISYANAKAWNIDPHNGVQNIYTGVRYLRELLDRYNGDPLLAAAAYHAGEGNMDAVLRGEKPKGFGVKSYEYPELVAKQLGEEVDFKQYLLNSTG